MVCVAITPAYDATNGEWSFTYQLAMTDGTSTCSQQREVHYIDGEGGLARIELARAAGIERSALWALGYEDDAFWTGLADQSGVDL